MPLASRLGDVCTGHSCYPPRPSCSGSPNFYTNNLPQMRLSDCYVAHGCCCCPPHGSSLACGSSTDFINNLPAGRTGDCVACGGAASAHSPDYDIGG